MKAINKIHHQKITPFLWFDQQAKEAAIFYTSLFENSSIEKTTYYTEEGQEVHGKDPESVMTVGFQLAHQQFAALNGGPHFKFTPAVSFFVNCKTAEEIDLLWEKLSAGGSVLMPLDKYPFSEKYGWLQDRYGLSWQLILADDAQKILPSFLFVGEQNGKAEEAINLYTSLFSESATGPISRYAAGEGGTEGTINYGRFTLAGQDFVAMDSSLDHPFTFNEALSFVVNCDSQEEIDHFWDKLSEGGDEKAQQCGWLKDKYGVSWQVVPAILAEMIADPDVEKSGRVMKAMMQMKKLDIHALENAYENE
jgi:predicted 3-demethylubiquinone-9 3-methyltransferase (glyoxalase superfamily)